jgi:hypothetical protein
MYRMRKEREREKINGKWLTVKTTTTYNYSS